MAERYVARVKQILWPARVAERTVVGARFQKRYVRLAVCPQQAGECRAGGAGADDDDVGLTSHASTTSTPISRTALTNSGGALSSVTSTSSCSKGATRANAARSSFEESATAIRRRALANAARFTAASSRLYSLIPCSRSTPPAVKNTVSK